MSLFGLSFYTLFKVFGIFSGLIFLLYLLKLREKLIPVSAHFLWERVLKSGQKSLLSRLLRRVFSFLLQILILLIAVLIMGDPRPTKVKEKTNKILLLIDESASMKAKDVKDSEYGKITRWEKAIQLANELVLKKKEKDQVLIVTFSSRAIPRSSWEKNKNKLMDVLKRIKPYDTPGSLKEGLMYANEVLYKHKNSKVVLITDGSSKDNEDIYWPPVEKSCKNKIKNLDITGLNIEILPIVAEPEKTNLAITSLAARPLPSDTETGEVLLKTANFGEKDVKARVDIYVDKNWRESINFTLLKNSEAVHLLNLPLVGQNLEARLSAVNGVDNFPIDNKAWAVIPQKPEPRILYVGEDNLFLEASLLLIPGYLEKVDPVEYKSEMTDNCHEKDGAPCNLVIFNEFMPPKPPKTLNQIYINPKGKPFKTSGKIKQNYQILWTGGKKPHPIMVGVSMKDVNLWGESTPFIRKGKDVSLMQVDARGTIMSILHKKPDGRRFIGLGFSLKDSDFVLQVSFPVFILNIVNWFMGTTPSFVATYLTGVLQEFRVDSDTIKFPTGKKLKMSGSGLVFRPNLAGIYTFIKDKEEVFSIAASLLSQKESDISVEPLKISCKTLKTWKPPTILSRTSNKIPWKTILMILLAGIGMLIMTYLRGAWGAFLAFLGSAAIGVAVLGLLLIMEYPVWIALIVTMFVLLMIEWFTYNRRITV
jgi:von Willebrand factor type A domain